MPINDIVMLAMALLFLGALMAIIFKNIPIPHTVMLLIVGVLLQWPISHIDLPATVRELTLTSDIILYLFLPALIFEAALGIQARQLAKDSLPIFVLAIPALLLSTFFVGLGVHWLIGLPLSISLLFGALISATDPVAVIALFKDLGVPRRLTVLVEGESLFNDATAIVLFHLLLATVLSTHVESFSIVETTLTFFTVFLGGIFLGLLSGTCISLIINYFSVTGSTMLVMSLALAYSIFVIAEQYLHISGVMAVMISAVVFGLVVVPRLSNTQKSSLSGLWEFLANICNTLLFILMGLSIQLDHVLAIIGSLAIVLLLVLGARASVIYTLLPLTVRWFRLPQITASEQHIIWWGGLKGGIAIAMVLAIPDSLAERQFLIDLTAGVVLFTLLVNAPSIRLLIKKLGLNRLNVLEKQSLMLHQNKLKDVASQNLDQLCNAGIITQEKQQQLAEDVSRLIDHNNESEKGFIFRDATAVRWEIRSLEKHFQRGVIGRITYLDLLHHKLNSLEYMVRNKLDFSDARNYLKKQKVLQRLDRSIVRFLREKDWAVPLLSRYLSIRLEEKLKNILANLMVDQAVLREVKNNNQLNLKQKQHLSLHYQKHIDKQLSMLSDVKQEFPKLYDVLEEKLAVNSALASAMKLTIKQHQLGELSSKSFQMMEKQLFQINKSIRKTKKVIFDDDYKKQLAEISLFKKIPQNMLDTLFQKGAVIGFIAGDEIIAEGDIGNALYVIFEGQVEIRDVGKKPSVILASLGSGQFFGEIALLGLATRTATVIADTSCVLFRIPHKIILNMAKQLPQLRLELEAIKNQRVKENSQNQA